MANPSANGTGVIIGVSDLNVLDIYHPDFMTAGGETRVLFLWDQQLDPQGSESSPSTAPILPGFTPIGGSSYGVEYNQVNPPSVPAYQTVRHQPPSNLDGHGTLVTGCAAGNGLGQNGTFVGAAPGANIIFVRNFGYLGGPVAWLCPDIEILERNGNPVPNPTYDPIRRFNKIIRITVRNRGSQNARNTEVYFYWADPATNMVGMFC